jgi:hypothetical protein
MERKKKNLLPITLLMIPMKDSQGANDGGKMCLYNGPTHSSSIVTIPLVSRYGKWYLYLSTHIYAQNHHDTKIKWKV